MGKPFQFSMRRMFVAFVLWAIAAWLISIPIRNYMGFEKVAPIVCLAAAVAGAGAGTLLGKRFIFGCSIAAVLILVIGAFLLFILLVATGGFFT